MACDCLLSSNFRSFFQVKDEEGDSGSMKHKIFETGSEIGDAAQKKIIGAPFSGRSGGNAGLSFGRPRRKSFDQIVTHFNIIICIFFNFTPRNMPLQSSVCTLKEELVAGDLPILAVPFTTAMLSLDGLPPNLSRMLEQLRKMSEPSATAPLRLMLVFALGIRSHD